MIQRTLFIIAMVVFALLTTSNETNQDSPMPALPIWKILAGIAATFLSAASARSALFC